LAEQEAGKAGSDSLLDDANNATDAFDRPVDLFTAIVPTPAFSHAQPGLNVIPRLVSRTMKSLQPAWTTAPIFISGE
jgi:hypothetical protein